MKQRTLNVFILLALISSLSIFLYLYWNKSTEEQVIYDGIKAFREYASEMRMKEPDQETVAPADDKSRVLYDEIVHYNQIIYENGQADLNDPFSFEQTEVDLKRYGIQTDIWGYMNIPRINIELPIYLGANEANLAKGAAHLGQTSIPIGGVNTNAVFAAHRGYRGTAMFRDIESIQPGDRIYITNIWETLVYQVVETKVILPTDIQEVLIKPEKDMITLITCHPYTKNYQRYAVFCERTDVEPEAVYTDTLPSEFLQNFWELSNSEKRILIEQILPIVGIIFNICLLVFFLFNVVKYKKNLIKRSKKI